MFWLIGFRCNAYGKHEREYFWAGPFENRKEALNRGKMCQEHGACVGFIDWMKGTNTVCEGNVSFLKRCKKVGLNPRHDWFKGETIDEKIGAALAEEKEQQDSV